MQSKVFPKMSPVRLLLLITVHTRVYTEIFKLYLKKYSTGGPRFRGFVIHGFDYPRLSNWVQNLLSADNSLGYPRIFVVYVANPQNRGPSLSAVLVFAECKGRNPRE
jgi:hypothetical protein